ncbi:MAG: hypothetical protein QOG62_524 [Thermoleophilaceae bacterium]|jgi:hypothetical protein|nr:hypothetical protein [Thermoleophilaceae bacterium]
MSQPTDKLISRATALKAGAGLVFAGGLSAVAAGCGNEEESAKGFDTASRNSDSEGTQYGRVVATFDPAVEDAFGAGDVGIANYALTLEYIEADFYDAAIASGLLKGDDLKLFQDIGKTEHAHVDAIKSFLSGVGATAAPRPETSFDLRSRRQVLQTAADLEDLGAAAYLGQATRIERPDVLRLALSIHTVEGAHAAALAGLIDRSIVPDGSIAAPADGKEVMDAIQPLLKKDGNKKS